MARAIARAILGPKKTMKMKKNVDIACLKSWMFSLERYKGFVWTLYKFFVGLYLSFVAVFFT
jgi:hypothetical protein